METNKFANGHKFSIGSHEIKIGLFGGRPFIQYNNEDLFSKICLSWSTPTMRELSYEQFWYDGPHHLLNLWWIGLYWRGNTMKGSEDYYELRLL